MSTGNEGKVLQVRPEGEAVVFSPREVSDQVQLIQHVMKDVMKDGEHWGKVPGCGDKPALLKPGAEKLCLTFRMAPKYDVEIIEMGNGHREARVKCSLYHIVSEKFLGEGVGSCSTMESKYRYRDSKRKCPACNADAIIKGKTEYGGGWLCFLKKSGCGAKFSDGDKTIEDQPIGRAENPDIADTYNTVLKMGKKRAQVDAVLSATAASDIFTQDIDEMAEFGGVAQPAEQKPKPAASEPAKPTSQSTPEIKSSTLVMMKIEKKEGKNPSGVKAPCWILEDIDGAKSFTFDEKVALGLSDAFERRLNAQVTTRQTKNGTEVISANVPQGNLLTQTEQRQLLTLCQEKLVTWEDLRAHIHAAYGAINLSDIKSVDYSKVYEWIIRSEKPKGGVK